MPHDSKSRPRLASNLRKQLFNLLGWECSECGATDRPLEVDHPWGRDWKPSKMSHYNRNLRYLREAKAGLVRVLCCDCNQRIRPVPMPPWAMLPGPF